MEVWKCLCLVWTIERHIHPDKLKFIYLYFTYTLTVLYKVCSAMDKLIVGHVNCLLYSYFSTAFIIILIPVNFI